MRRPTRVPIRPVTAGRPFPFYDAGSGSRYALVSSGGRAAQVRVVQPWLLTEDRQVRGLLDDQYTLSWRPLGLPLYLDSTTRSAKVATSDQS